MAKLYGDGIHSDTAAIQEMLDSGMELVYLPVPEKEYLIDAPLKIHGNQILKLDLYTRIKLADHSDCIMLMNEERDIENVAVIGGIWDFNNLNQKSNPLAEGSVTGVVNNARKPDYGDEYLGVPMRFSYIKNLLIRDVTIKDPVTFGIQMAYIEQFTVEDITFDYNYGNPFPINMDGVHLDGGCNFGVIRNLKGTCYDDLVAINADDFCDGPISNIVVDGIFAYDCHSAVRVLSAGAPVKNITITNVFGTYFQYCVGLTCFFYEKDYGIFDNITVSNVYASKAERHTMYQKDGTVVFAPLFIDKRLRIGHLTIRNVHRVEEITPIHLIDIWEDTEIKRMSVSDVSQENHTGERISILNNAGKIGTLYLRNIDTDEDMITGEGRIEKVFEE